MHRVVSCSLAAVCGLIVGCSGDSNQEAGSPRITIQHLEADLKTAKPVKRRQVLRPGTQDRIVMCRPRTQSCPHVLEVPPTATWYYLVAKDAPVDEMDVVRGSAGVEQDISGRPVVVFRLTSEGARAFRELTKKVARSARTQVSRTAS